MWDRIRKAGQDHNSVNSVLLSSLIPRYGVTVCSQAIRHAVIACAFRLLNGTKSAREQSALEYTGGAYKYTIAALNGPECYLEVAFASYFLAFGCMAGKTIFDANEEVFKEMITHLSGFTACLVHITQFCSLDLDVVTAMKCAWYNLYAVFIRFIKRGHPHECRHGASAILAVPSKKLSELADSWWEMAIDEINTSPQLQERYRLSKLKLALYELQRDLNVWYFRTEEKTLDQQFTESGKAAIVKGLVRVRAVILQFGPFLKLSALQNTVVGSQTCTKTLQDAVVAYIQHFPPRICSNNWTFDGSYKSCVSRGCSLGIQRSLQRFFGTTVPIGV